MNWGQVLPALVWLGIGATIAGGAYKLGVGALNNPGPGLFAFVIGVGMATLSLSIAATGLRSAAAPMINAAPKHTGAALTVVGALAFYALALERIGYVLCTLVFLLVLLSALGRRSWPVSVAASVLITAGSYLIFTKALKINLPAGPLGL